MGDVFFTFDTRRDSIEREIKGTGPSLLLKETAGSVRYWQDVHEHDVFPALFRHLYTGQHAQHMQPAASDAAFVAAVYEWCQKAWWDDGLGDEPTFNGAYRDGSLFCGGMHGT